MNEEYKQFLKTFAALVSDRTHEVTPEGVALQISFTFQKPARWRPGQSQQAILNIAAAYHAGFIQDFPHLVILDREFAATASLVALDFAATRMSVEQ